MRLENIKNKFHMDKLRATFLSQCEWNTLVLRFDNRLVYC